MFNHHVPQLGTNNYIDSSAVLIGDIVLGADVSVWPTVVIRGDVAEIRIGAETNIQDGAVLHVSHQGDFAENSAPLTIGERVTIGHRAVIHGCTIGDACLVGIGAIILDNAVLEDYVMLGAGALVPAGKVLEKGYLYIGAPAKKSRALTEEEMQFLDYSAQHYVKLKNQYLEIDS